MKLLLAVALVLVMASFSFAGICPAGASDCFLCGGTNGIPCAKTDTCKGYHDPNSGLDIACACPQGKPCQCYCPYADYGAQKVGPQPPADTCPSGCVDCTADKTVCISHTMEEIAPAEQYGVISASEGELLVSDDGGATWARAKPGDMVGVGYTLKTMKGGSATVLMKNGWTTTLEENTRIETTVKEENSQVWNILEMTEGAVFGYTDQQISEGKQGWFAVENPDGISTAVRTQFYVSYDPATGQSVVKLYRGGLNVTSASGSVELAQNQMVTLTPAGAGPVSAFDPSGDKTPFSSGCGGAAVLLSVLLLGAAAVRAG